MSGQKMKSNKTGHSSPSYYLNVCLYTEGVGWGVGLGGLGRCVVICRASPVESLMGIYTVPQVLTVNQGRLIAR